MDARWDLKSHLASTLHENFGVLGHTRWTQGEIWKVISHAPRMRTFSLYTFQMSSRMDVRWHLKSHLASTSRVRTLVWWRGPLVTLDRWTQGEIWKVISCAPRMRTLVWWRGHLVMLDGCEVMFEVISCAPHVRTLVWWRGHLVVLDGRKVRFEKSSRVHLTWELCY